MWELELWKRAEETKFKNHLKQVELETIENVTKDWRSKEEKRDAQLALKISAIESLEKKLRSKAQELQKREGKMVQLEEELKHKIHEVSRQLATKEEEIINIKKRFKDEKLAMQNDKKNLQEQVNNAKALLDEVEGRYRTYRQDMEESPLSVLRTEIGKKNIEIAELNTKLQKASEENEAVNQKFKKLRQEHTKLRREMERQKDESMQKQAEELERIKMELKNQTLAEQERQQILMLREELTSVQTKLLMAEEAMQQQQPMYVTGMSMDGYQTQNAQMTSQSNPFATRNVGIYGTKISQNKDTPSKQQQPKSQLEQLQDLRRNLLDNGLYKEDDDMIIEIDNKIKIEKSRQSPGRQTNRTLS